MTFAPSLWQELIDGRAGVGVRIVLALISLAVYVGLAMIGSVFLPRWCRAGGGSYYTGYNTVRYVRPRDELIVVLVVMAGMAWVATVLWLFLQTARQMAPSFSPLLKTLGVIGLTVLLCVLAGDLLRGDSELVIAMASLLGRRTDHADLAPGRPAGQSRVPPAAEPAGTSSRFAMPGVWISNGRADGKPVPGVRDGVYAGRAGRAAGVCKAISQFGFDGPPPPPHRRHQVFNQFERIEEHAPLK